MYQLRRGGALLLLLAALLGLLPARAQAEQTGGRVVGYFPYWQPGAVHKLQYDVLTHINYAFAIPTESGGLRPLEQPALARKIRSQAHAAGVKVLLAVGGWSYNNVPLEATFAAATATAEKRRRLVRAILEVVDAYGFDGVDMDWEYPRLSDGTYRQYEALMLELSRELKSRGKLLTAAVQAGVSPGGAVWDTSAHTDAVLQAVDWINIMAYDGGEGADHSTYDFAGNAARHWREDRGVPADKIVLGVPFYARSGYVTYEILLSAVPDAWKRDSAVYQGKTVWYNGVGTVEKKARYALTELGGVMAWELSQDTSDRTYSLLSAIGRVKEAACGDFQDVPAGSWYAADVADARARGLMQGTGAGRFSPLRTVTAAEGIALAARIHRIYHAGSDGLEGGSPWYQGYVDYALEQGILDRRPEPQALSAVLTRGAFAALLDRSLPEEALEAVNTVAAIPDVEEDSPYGEAVYRLYRAGVLAGTDAQGTFRPQNSLTRAEAAALVLRMTDAGRRISSSL